MSGKTPEDIEFEQKLAKATYKTTYQDIGAQKTNSTLSFNLVSSEKGYGISGKFTDVHRFIFSIYSTPVCPEMEVSTPLPRKIDGLMEAEIGWKS